MNRIGSALLLALGVILALAFSLAFTLQLGVLAVGVPPGWLALVLVAAGAGLYAWFLLKGSGWFGAAHTGRRRVMPLVWLGIAAIGVSVVTGMVWNARVSSLVKQLKAAGCPVTLADLVPDVPEAKNAYAPMEAFYKRFNALVPTDKDPTAMNKILNDVSNAMLNASGSGVLWQDGAEKVDEWKWGPGALAGLDAVVAKHAKLFRELERGLSPLLDKYQVRAYTMWKAGGEKAIPEVPLLPGYVNMCRMYRVLSMRCALRGDMAGAWRYVGYELKLTHILGQDPTLFVKMIAVANAGVAVRSAGVILQNRPGAVLPAPIAKEIAGLLGVKWVQDGFAEEAARWLHSRTALRRVAPWSPPPDTGVSRMEFMLMRRLDFTGLVDPKLHAIIAKQILPTVRQDKWDPAIAGDQVIPYPQWYDRWVPWMQAPAFGQLLQKQFEMKLKARFVLAASALHAYRARTGRLPASLADLPARDVARELIIDDFTGKELVLKKTKGGFELSSPGPWGKGYDSKGQVTVWRDSLGPKPPAPKPAAAGKAKKPAK